MSCSVGSITEREIVMASRHYKAGDRTSEICPQCERLEETTVVTQDDGVTKQLNAHHSFGERGIVQMKQGACRRLAQTATCREASSTAGIRHVTNCEAPLYCRAVARWAAIATASNAPSKAALGRSTDCRQQSGNRKTAETPNAEERSGPASQFDGRAFPRRIRDTHAR